MAEYTGTRSVDADGPTLFAFLSKVSNLPRYFPRITDAEPAGGEAVDVTAVIEPAGQERHAVEAEAWFRVDERQQRVEWGSEGPNDYRGELEVTDDGEQSQVLLTLHTESDHPEIQDSLDETLDTIAELVEAEGIS